MCSHSSPALFLSPWPGAKLRLHRKLPTLPSARRSSPSMGRGSLPWVIRRIDPTTHTPLWADPGFDDSKWETVDLTPRGASRSSAGFSNYVKGWTARGHAGHWGYAWYRIRVQVAAMPGEELALAGSADVDDAYQFFSHGSSDRQLRQLYRQPADVLLHPARDVQPAAGACCPTVRILRPGAVFSGLDVALLRLSTESDVGGFHTAPLLGNANAVSAGYQLDWLQLMRAQITGVAS